MSFFDRITGLFTKGGREEALLMKGLEHAKAGRPEEALAIYNDLLTSPAIGTSVRARALFNRALAYSSLDNDDKALTDLQAVLALPNLQDNVQSAARSQMARVRQRSERERERNNK